MWPRSPGRSVVRRVMGFGGASCGMVSSPARVRDRVGGWWLDGQGSLPYSGAGQQMIRPGQHVLGLVPERLSRLVEEKCNSQRGSLAPILAPAPKRKAT